MRAQPAQHTAQKHKQILADRLARSHGRNVVEEPRKWRSLHFKTTMEAPPSPPLTSLTIHLSTPAVEEISRLVESRAGSDASDVVEKMLLSVLPSFRELHARYAASAAAAPPAAPPGEEGDEVDDAGADEAAAAAARRPHFFKNIQSIDPSGKAHWRPEHRGPARGVRPAPSPLTPLPSQPAASGRPSSAAASWA